MNRATLDALTEQLALADTLLARRNRIIDPQDLPGRYGRVVRSLDRILAAVDCEAVIGGGWAVWRHGYVSRVTQDVDIVLPMEKIEAFLQAASVSGFQVLARLPGRWPKLQHKDTMVDVDVMPEGQRPGIPPDFAPTTIPAPRDIGANGTRLRFMTLQGLIELRIAAGRLKDKADVVELIRANGEQTESIREHLSKTHPQYAHTYDELSDEVRKTDVQR